MTNMIKDDFATLDYQYTLNPDEEEAVIALNELPTDERNLFILYVECNAHYTEVARKTHLSVQTVKEHIDLIKNKLKEKLRNGQGTLMDEADSLESASDGDGNNG